MTEPIMAILIGGPHHLSTMALECVRDHNIAMFQDDMRAVLASSEIGPISAEIRRGCYVPAHQVKLPRDKWRPTYETYVYLWNGVW